MNNQEFLKEYRKNKNCIWIKVKLTNGKEFYFNHYPSWKGIKLYCEQNAAFIEEFNLQFRSHEIIIDIPTDLDGFYFVRSILGQMGADSKHYYTVGLIHGDKVQKHMYIIPELIQEKSYEDTIESCFQESIIYNVGKKSKNTEEQIQA